MKRFFWNVRFAAIAMLRAGMTPRCAYEYVRAMDDNFEEGDSPSEAFSIDVSYWNN